MDPASTQIVQRDRHAAFLAAIAVTGGSIERFAVEIRNLQHTEIGELQEPFRAGQAGSSAMPHKRNPILAERLTGLARLLRGYALAGMEDQALWHERDISHSSVERVALPGATTLLHYMLERFRGLVEGLVVRPERMVENMAAGHGLHASSRVLSALVEAGLARHGGLRASCSASPCSAADERHRPSGPCVEADPAVTAVLPPEVLERCFDDRAWPCGTWTRSSPAWSPRPVTDAADPGPTGPRLLAQAAGAPSSRSPTSAACSSWRGGLVERGYELVSTGGTARAIREAGLPVTDVAEVTGAPEMLDGRVKTLHPRIAGGVLADLREPSHRAQLAEQGIEPFELVVVNLYRFEEAAARPGIADDELIEEIDIGGPTLVRAAAKNHASVGDRLRPGRLPGRPRRARRARRALGDDTRRGWPSRPSG